MVEMIKGDRIVFAYLFPILLFNSDGDYMDETSKTHQIQYTTLIEEHFVKQLKNNRSLVSKRLGVTIEVVQFLQ